MAAIASSLVSARDPSFRAHSGNTLKTLEKSFVTCHPLVLSSAPLRQMKAGVTTPKRQLILRSAYRHSEGGRPNTTSTFIGGFLLGGTIVGTLACVYAPQIRKALAGTDKKELMRKLPKFIYDEEKTLEKNRKVLTQKIEELNLAMDQVSSQIHANDKPNGVTVSPDEIEAAI